MNRTYGANPEKPISIGILAMGGQGGGVLTDWIVAVAEANGWHAQSTSVPGVAQRTGATLYYIEMLPPRGGKPPILNLMPTPGDVDIVIAAELMEAGRSILRGLSTPEKTLLITSTHRSYAVAEKEKPGEAIGDPRVVNSAAGVAARRVISFDMEAVAKAAGTVISAPMLGALAGAQVLPFPQASFEDVIKAGGKGATQSLNGFAEGVQRAATHDLPRVKTAPEMTLAELPESFADPKLNALLAELRRLPPAVQPMAFAGMKRVVDFQDADYGAEYLARLAKLIAVDSADKDFAFAQAAAKYLANAMAYDDVIGVADLKTRSTRFSRIAEDMKAEGAPLYLTEFMHPRGEELVGLLPTRWGHWVQARPGLMAWIDKRFNTSRKMETAKLRGFLQLYAIAGLRKRRRSLLRHEDEMAHAEHWLALATQHIASNYDLACGIIAARRLVKGYSDTHARGLSKFNRVLSAVPTLQSRADAGDWMQRLIVSALKDEDGTALNGALQTLKSL